ncbi:undecaprenyl-diphosphate phosphatase [Tepidiforma sp.]|uniref:undecaprenyl-diphosphate phosphatase n=1 Tax=Tepidiforma sp. TaxID=2682230 RepID=UPI002629D107|nr:undecaprenyl-diphosphate phosphatase [Tepidiforma sp.]MCX7617536.1 undecaprenyl-diphosphate phosphatase [Tepidiforma sp.]
MDLVRAVILGIVQGVAEFLPISSSGHLILVPALFGWEDQGLAFDVGLHGGTLLALLAYFWRDWYVMFRTGLADLARHGARVSAWRTDTRLLWLLAIGSVPAAVAGLLLDDWIESHVRQPWLVAIMLALMGTVMLAADSLAPKRRPMASVGILDAVVIGVGQAFALIPGVSRSGATVTVALARGLRREDAVRFAFLLGTPAFVGALLLKSADLAALAGPEARQMAVGFVTSAVVGFAAIHFLLRWVRTRSLLVFVLYRYAVAIVTLATGAYRIAG